MLKSKIFARLGRRLIPSICVMMMFNTVPVFAGALGTTVIGDIVHEVDKDSEIDTEYLGYITDENTEEYVVKTALENGTITDAQLLDMNITREDLLKIVDAAIAANTDSVNSLRYEVQMEQWSKVLKYDENDMPYYTYEWVTVPAYEEREYHSMDIESEYRIHWTDIYAMYQIAVNDDAELSNWSEEMNEDGSIGKVTSRLSDSKLEDILNIFRYHYDYLFDASRFETDRVLSYDEMEKYCYEYRDSDEEYGLENAGQGDTQHWCWNHGDGTYQEPPESDEYIGTTRWRKKIPVSVVDKIYNQNGIEFVGPNTYEPYSHNPTKGGSEACSAVDEISANKVTGRVAVRNPVIFNQFCSKISSYFTFDTYCDLVQYSTGDTRDVAISSSPTFKKWAGYKELVEGYWNGTVSNPVAVMQQREFSGDGAIIGSRNDSYNAESEEADSSVDYFEWAGESRQLADVSDMETYIFQKVSERYGKGLACAVLGNIYGECNRAGNPLTETSLSRREKSIHSDHPRAGTGGWGLCQWTGGRADALYNLSLTMGLPWNSIEVQTEMIIRELGPSSAIWNFKPKHVQKYNLYSYVKGKYGIAESHEQLWGIADDSSPESVAKLATAVWASWEKPAYKDPQNSVDSRVEYAMAFAQRYK